MSATLLPFPRAVFYDANGNPLAAGFVWTYVPNTTTPKTSWQDAGETTPNANPILLDTNGSCLLYGAGQYTLAVIDALGNQVPAYSGLTTDTSFALTTFEADLASQTDATKGSTLVGYFQAIAGWVGRTLKAKLLDYITVLDFGADNSGGTDCTLAFQAAVNYAASQSGGQINIPAGTYKLTGTVAVVNSAIRFVGAGMWTTVLSFNNGSQDCLTFEGPAPASIQGNAVSDLTITGVAKTGGRAIFFWYAANWFVERVYMNTVWRGIEAFVINTGTIRNVTMAGVTDASGYGIYYHAPGDGSARSDELNLHDVVVNCLYSGSVGLLIDGWANTVNAYQYVALDVSIGIQVQNTSGSNAFYPTYGEFVNSVVDGASLRSVGINAGQVWRFTGCEIGNNSGSSGQGGADDFAFFVAPDTGHSETAQVYVVNSNIGGCKQSAVDIGSHDNSFIGCTFYQGITSPANTYPSVSIAAPASDTIIVGCKNSYFGAPVGWSYGVQMASGSFRTLVVACNFNIGSQSAAINNLSGDTNTFANEYIGAPSTAGVGPVMNFPKYAAAPPTPVLGETYYNTSTNHLQTWDGSAWNNLW